MWFPPSGGSSPTLSFYAEGFVSLSFKINFASMSVCEFTEFIPQLHEQNSVPLFKTIAERDILSEES